MTEHTSININKQHDSEDPNPVKKKENMQSLKLLLLVLLVVQNSSFALVGRYTRSSVSTEELYVVNHVIIITECVKFVIACFLEAKYTPSSLWKSIQEHVFASPLDALKISVPALLYLIQTSLLFIALSHLPAPLYQVAFQGKLLTTAFVSVIMLQRRYTVQQWICLLTLGVGVAIVVMGDYNYSNKLKNNSTANGEVFAEEDATTTATKLLNNPTGAAAANMMLGLVCVTAACFCSALAGVYTEKLLKRPTNASNRHQKAPASLWMRNIQMAFFSICIALVQRGTATGPDAEKPFLYGFTAWVYSLVVIQAVGGLLVAAVMKYTDNVLKGLAMAVSVVLSTACSMTLFGTPLTPEFVMGSIVVLGSVYLFSNSVPAGIMKCATTAPCLPQVVDRQELDKEPLI
mmetsp:Transcript_462/g.742  ORF Transcript_462/g.742 Transcript_462/m.742 type:complete len:404 (+) Transcript_462:61-1272(+)